MTLSRTTNDGKKIAAGIRIGEEVGKRLAERLHRLDKPQNLAPLTA